MCSFGNIEKELTTKRDGLDSRLGMPRLGAYVLLDLGVVPMLNYSDFVAEFLSPDPFGECLTISTLRSVVPFALGQVSISGWEDCHEATSVFRTSGQLDFVKKMEHPA
jgi:hypothetical protein